MQQKKPTNAQLQRRLNNAVLHIDRTKDTKTVYFTDKGLRLTINENCAIVATGFHSHVFNAITPNGYSRPYLYIKQFIDIAIEHMAFMETENGYSYARLFDKLKEEAKEEGHDKEYNLCWYIDLWLYNIFAPLYAISEDSLTMFVCYESYIHNIARDAVLFGEHKEDMTNKAYAENIVKRELEILDGVPEQVIIKAKSDEERVQEEIAALEEHANETALKEQGAQEDGRD